MPTATTPKPAADSAPNTWKPELREVPLERITTGANVRSAVGDVTELRDSIKAHGVLQPVRVVELAADHDGTHYELILGHRRLEAVRAAGLATIPAVVEPFASDGRNGVAGRTVAQLIENLQREDLNALDTARAYRSVLDQGVTQRELGKLIGIAQPTIANTLALLKAPEAIQQRVAAGELTRSHVEAIARLPKGEQEEVARRAVEHGLSTRGLEGEIEMAAARQADADRERDRVAADAKGIDKALRKAGAVEGATVIIYGAGSSPLAKPIRELGWAPMVETGWRHPKDEVCDCVAFRVNDYADGHTRGKFSVAPVCISAKHDAARKAATDSDRKADEERWAREHEEAQRERMAAAEQRRVDDELLTRWVSGGKAGVERFRAILAAIVSDDQWAFDALVERHVPEDDLERLDELDDPIWAVVSKLELPQVMAEFGRFVVDAALGEQARADLLALARAEEPKPKPKRRAKAKA